VLGDLGELGEIGDLNDLVGSDGTGLGLEDLGLEDLGLGDIGLMIETIREWTIAHEVGHMWWHSLVGNDSNTVPVVDEALAQHSACLVERVLRPEDATVVCDVNTSGQYEQLVSLMGIEDDAADQATDEFDSSLQYGALVYAKAPVFYRTLEARYGVDETTAALATIVADNAFGQITSDQLRDQLGVALGDPAGVHELWQRWMEEAHGAEDL
jgi:aminopeptidase N